MSIHQRIKERRLALGLNSHKALAELVGVSWQTVQLWEKEGGTAPKRGRIEKVAEVLGVTTGWLQNGGQGLAVDPLGLVCETNEEIGLLTAYRLAKKLNDLRALDSYDAITEELFGRLAAERKKV